MDSYKTQIEEAVLAQQPLTLGDDRPAAPAQVDIFDALKRIRDAAVRLAVANVGDGEAIIKAALAAYDKYVAPYDIPGIGPFVEKFVDAAGRTLLDRMLRAVIGRISAVQSQGASASTDVVVP